MVVTYSWSEYRRASSKLDRKELGIDWESVQRKYGLNAYSAAAKSAELAKEAIRESLEHPKEDHRAIFEANERRRHAKSAELANDYMQRQLQATRHARSEASRNQDRQRAAYYHQRRLENQPFMEAADDETSTYVEGQ